MGSSIVTNVQCQGRRVDVDSGEGSACVVKSLYLLLNFAVT